MVGTYLYSDTKEARATIWTTLHLCDIYVRKRLMFITDLGFFAPLIFFFLLINISLLWKTNKNHIVN